MKLTNETKILRDYLKGNTTCEIENLESKIQLLQGIKQVIKLSKSKTEGTSKIKFNKFHTEDVKVFRKLCKEYRILATVPPEEPETMILINTNEDYFEDYVNTVLDLISDRKGRYLTPFEILMIVKYLTWAVEGRELEVYESYLGQYKIDNLAEIILQEFNFADTKDKIETIYQRIKQELDEGD